MEPHSADYGAARVALTGDASGGGAAAPRRITRVEASAYLKERHGVSYAPQSLAKLACTGGGPRFYKFRRSVLYSTADLDAWVSEVQGRPVTSTSEARSVAAQRRAAA